jgi:ABC-2 type transport system permease protein
MRRLITLSPIVILSSLESVGSYWLFGSCIGVYINRLARGVIFSKFVFAGILMPLIVSSSFRDACFNIFIMKFDKSLKGILASPVSTTTLLFAVITSALTRCIVQALPLTLIYLFVNRHSVAYPIHTIAFLILIAIVFSSLGLVEGVYASNFQSAGTLSLALLNACFLLGGTVFSIQDIGSRLLININRVNPLYYLIQAARYYIIGRSSFIPGIFFNVFLVIGAVFSIVLAMRVLSKNSNVRL